MSSWLQWGKRRFLAVLEMAVMLMLTFPMTVSCAKKMLPPSPDRFAPSLEEIYARSRVQIELVFDEPVIPLTESGGDSVVVQDVFGLSRKVRGVSSGRRRERLLVWTEPLEPVRHRISGRVKDDAGNVGHFHGWFSGSRVVDTIPPAVRGILPLPGSTVPRRDLTFEVTFSEPVDTVVVPPAVVVPCLLDTLFRRSWSSDWLSLDVRYSVSTANSGIVYFLLLPGVRDLSANRCRQMAYTYVVSDSLLSTADVRGRVRWDGGDIGAGVVFFDAEVTEAIAPVRSDGSFAAKVRHGSYLVRCVLDVDSDGFVDFASDCVQFSTQLETLELEVAPTTVPCRVDAYCR
ncbi:MAG: hypothetical protein ABIK43_02230 [candidate division WOR-3 bacterium]